MMKTVLLAGATLLAITGCSKKGADSNNDGKITTEEAQKEMSSGGSVAMKPGLWEVKVSFNTIDAPGLPAQAAAMMKKQMGQGVTIKSCMTKEQAEKPGADFFGGANDSNCIFSEMNRSGNSMKVAMSCKPAGGITVNNKMEGTFAAESYSMTMDQKTERTPMGAMTMKGKIEGRRVGDCPA